jgi:hypothetical protein
MLRKILSCLLFLSLALAIPFLPAFAVNQPSGLAFPDVPGGFWAAASISQLVKDEVISGYPDGTFQPENLVKRSAFAKMAVLALKLSLVLVEYPTFPDVLGNHWALTYVETAFANELMMGYPDGTFQPDGLVTLAEMLTVIVRAQGWALQDPPSSPVILVEEPNGTIRNLAEEDWFRPFVGAAINHGLLVFPEDPHLAKPGAGSGEYSLAFSSPATRAQTAVLLTR